MRFLSVGSGRGSNGQEFSKIAALTQAKHRESDQPVLITPSIALDILSESVTKTLFCDNNKLRCNNLKLPECNHM
jgi:hypothetical protein